MIIVQKIFFDPLGTSSPTKSHPWDMTQGKECKSLLLWFISFICENIHKVWYWNWLCNWNLMFYLLTLPRAPGMGPKIIVMLHAPFMWLTHTPDFVGFRPMVKEEIAKGTDERMRLQYPICFWAHLSRWLKVSYFDLSLSVVRTSVRLSCLRPSSVNFCFKRILPLNHWSKLHMNVPPDAIFQNCINGFALPNRRTTRVPDNKYFKQHLIHWSKCKMKVLSQNCSS